MTDRGVTMYERTGGTPWFESLAERFYRAVAADPVLRPLYPADPARLDAARDHLCRFLIQYWGGPDDYSRQRGHPRLRMRHAPFAIGPTERDAWYRHMADAVRAGGLDAGNEAEMLAYFEMAATHMINQVGVSGVTPQPGRAPAASEPGSQPSRPGSGRPTGP